MNGLQLWSSNPLDALYYSIIEVHEQIQASVVPRVWLHDSLIFVSAGLSLFALLRLVALWK